VTLKPLRLSALIGLALLVACSSEKEAEPSGFGSGADAADGQGETDGSASAGDVEEDSAAADTSIEADTGSGDTVEDTAEASDTATNSGAGSGDATEDTTAEPDSTTDTEADGSGGPTLPLPGFGTITGSCGVLDDELLSPDPSLIVNAIDFGSDPWDNPADLTLLTSGGQEMVADGNAGGSSLESEIFSLEVLTRCEGATLVKTETEVVYDVSGSITDILVEIDGMKVGVSVTRAVGFPRDAAYTEATASALLTRKLTGIQESTANVSADDRWVKQILHVIAYADQHVAAMEAAFEVLEPSVKADTILWVTRSDGDDEFIY
jgi:hypothetical protein